MRLLQGSALALKRFHTTQAQVASQAPLVWIEGRRPGLGGFVLSALGIDTTTTLIVTQRDVVFREGSIFGQMNSMMPLTAVASVHAGYSKPVQYLAAAAMLLFGSLSAVPAAESPAPLAVGVLGALVCVVLYAIRRRFAVFVESSGGAVFGLVFLPSVIEGVQVDIQRVQSVVDLTRELVIAAQRGSQVPQAPGHTASGTFGVG